MRGATEPFGRPAESVFLLADEETRSVGSDQRASLHKWLEAMLPSLNWRSHIFVVPQAGSGSLEQAKELAAMATRFLECHAYAAICLHPVIAMQSGDAQERAQWETLLERAKPFQTRAYREQGRARFEIFPIISPSPELSEARLLEAASFFDARASRPSLFLQGQPSPGLVTGANRGDVRLYVDGAQTAVQDGSRVAGIVHQLWVSHVFESVLDRVDGDKDKLLTPCRSHVVADERVGGALACLRQWHEGESPVPFGQRFGRNDGPTDGPAAGQHIGDQLAHPVPKWLCPDCIGRCLIRMKQNMEANARSKEGRQVCLDVALALSREQGQHMAAALAHNAVELSQTDRDRAAALIHEGLCHLSLEAFEKAEDALQRAAAHSETPGLVAFHRGQVQFAWRDYIEALDRYQEALQAPCEEVPVEDIHFQMALCHINIEEYAEARQHLEQALKPGTEEAPLAFYRGICDLGEGRVQTAMDHFREALRLGPAKEDLGRVLFYVGTCLKELERFDEAIHELEKAIQADPADLANYNLLGFCCYKTKRHEQAVACFRRAVAIDPRSAIDWANLGSNLRDLGRIEEAVAMYEKALALDPTIAFARENLAKLTGRQEP